MKITPISNQPIPTATETPSVRNLKMNTVATPLSAVPPESQEQLSISDNNEETKSEPVVEATQPISPQLAALAKQRRALQVKERELEQLKRDLEAKAQGSAQIPIEKLKAQPLQVLLDNGVTYEDLTQALMSNQVNPEVAAIKSEINAFKEGIEKRFSEQEETQIRSALSQMRVEAERLLPNAEYEAVREMGGVNKVIQLIEKTYRQSGEILPVSEALTLVEKALRDRYSKVANLSFLQSQQNPADSQPQMQVRQGMRTLTNKDTASVPMNAKQRALAAFYGTLKK